ncbi:MAG TPA: TlpA disulfide reductase family protein [Thermoanaerobaculia bacterium]|nr:TlpA disulfide reductase family protein [Thermoanaerobaculia bacterium]
MRGLAWLAALALLPGLAAAAQAERGQGVEDLLGRRPPEWTVSHWRNGPPVQLAELRGKVVLVRWWTAPHCPYCRATAPALNDFHRRYRERGLAVLGFYHHKSQARLDPEQVNAWAEQLGFEFPVAIDGGWRTLRRWWLDRVESGWTSVTFLLDREGVVRHVHPGGQYVEGDRDYAALRARIEELLAEPQAALGVRTPRSAARTP